MPTVAVIGRPNAGKSTLFNRLIRERRAIESDTAGTTRDRVFGTVKGEKIDFLLVDTGGLTTDFEGKIEADMRQQAEESISGADVIYFCIDARSEITAEEEMISGILRRKKETHVPVFLIATKAERFDAETFAGELYGMGISDKVFFVSAKENIGIFELLDATQNTLLKNGFSQQPSESEKNYSAKICLLGKPNAGKSTLINTLSGREISIVSEESGTTRDQIDSDVHFEKESFLLIDTAGITKKSVMNKAQIERYSRLRALSALHRANVAILLIDATEGISHQDQMIAGEMKEVGIGVIIIFSKWDLARAENRRRILNERAEKDVFRIEEERSTKEEREKEVSKGAISLRENFVRQAQKKFSYLPWAPVLFLSAMEKRGIGDIFRTAKNVEAERSKKIPTRKLNQFLEQVVALHPPASRGTKQLKPKYIVQSETSPPKFLVFVNDPDAAHFSFARFLENRLREAFGFWGTPIFIELRKKSGNNPYLSES